MYRGRPISKSLAVSEFQDMLCRMYPEGGTLDYWTAQLMWTEFIDDLCKQGKITQEQFASWTNPMKYGKPVRVRVRRDVPALSASI